MIKFISAATMTLAVSAAYAQTLGPEPTSDRDGDGVPDGPVQEDYCPDEPGPAGNHGCPREMEVLVVYGTRYSDWLVICPDGSEHASWEWCPGWDTWGWWASVHFDADTREYRYTSIHGSEPATTDPTESEDEDTPELDPDECGGTGCEGMQRYADWCRSAQAGNFPAPGCEYSNQANHDPGLLEMMFKALFRDATSGQSCAVAISGGVATSVFLKRRSGSGGGLVRTYRDALIENEGGDPLARWAGKDCAAWIMGY